MSRTKLIILGCGNGAGTPAIGNHWGKCDPGEPKNRRTRASIVLLSEKTTILVDTGPDLREQLNRHDIKDLDYILYTHSHADHLHGIDEIRTLSRLHKKMYPVYGDTDTIDEIKERFTYMIEERSNGFYPPVLLTHEIDRNKKINFGDLEVLAFEQDHGTRTSLGFRIGDTAYSTDMKRLNDIAFRALDGVQTWIVDGCGFHQDDNPVHANFKEVYAYNERVRAPRVIFTHLAPNMDYQRVMADLPPGYELAYDGMEIDDPP